MEGNMEVPPLETRTELPQRELPRNLASDAARTAAQRWLTEHGDILWRFCVARTGSQQIAEDIVQDTLLAGLKNAATFEGGSTERTWLLGIAANKIADHFRKRSREATHLAGGRHFREHPDACTCASCDGEFTKDGRWATVASAWPDASTSEDRDLLLQHLQACLAELPPAQAKLVWLRELKGVPSEQVCKVLAISATNMWTRMHRARSSLRECLENKLRGVQADKEPLA